MDRRQLVSHRHAAALVCAISGRHDIPLDRTRVIGHNEVPGSNQELFLLRKTDGQWKIARYSFSSTVRPAK